MTWRDFGGFLIASAMVCSIFLMVVYRPEFVALATRLAPYLACGFLGAMLAAVVILTTEQRK